MPDFGWISKMALRDFRKNISRLLLFVSSIVVGIAALVAISSFGENLTKDINNQAQELLGAIWYWKPTSQSGINKSIRSLLKWRLRSISLRWLLFRPLVTAA